jgi:hypothetical protein
MPARVSQLPTSAVVFGATSGICTADIIMHISTKIELLLVAPLAALWQ